MFGVPPSDGMLFFPKVPRRRYSKLSGPDFRPMFLAAIGHRNLAPEESFICFSFEKLQRADSAPRLLNVETMSQIISRFPPESLPEQFSSAQPRRALRLGGDLSDEEIVTAETQSTRRLRRELFEAVVKGIMRRFRRERRRRKVGRAYDMALEITHVIPHGSEVLDVGCGNGFIAHHLSAMLGTSTMGIDLSPSAEAPIDYSRYDGVRFPAPDKSFDAVLLCYVLHHAQDVSVVLREVRRVLRDGGRVVIYEDIPETWWDQGVCWIHDQQWRGRTGPCRFRQAFAWHALFKSFGFEIVSERTLSRARNLTHPVSRRFCLLKKINEGVSAYPKGRYRTKRDSLLD
jgi:ubiquinone/menaquinone biosynthesis C-methylase UbiE